MLASQAAAQPQAPVRQRQDRRASLPTTPAEPISELYLAAGNLTTVVLNRRLDSDSLVVDRTRFKWVDVGEHFLNLELAADLNAGERLIIEIGFKDRALPARAVFAVVTHPRVMDGKVEVDRKANSPEALLAELTQKEAELEELKARYVGNGPGGQRLNKDTPGIVFIVTMAPGDTSGLNVAESKGYQGAASAQVVIRLRTPPGSPPWALGQARITSAGGAPVTVLSVQLKPAHLAPGDEGEVVLETKTPPWALGKAFGVELVDASGQRRLSFNLSTL
jgi:uncharacterized protein (TIGR02268 family)